MATIQDYRDGRPIVASGGSNAAGWPKVTVMENVFDATRLAAAGAAADVFETLNVPAGTFVHKVFVIVLDGEAAQTINVGDGADPDGYVAAGDVSTDGTRIMGAGAFSAGKFYTADDTIDIEVPATMEYETLRVKVLALVTMIG